MVYGKRVFYPSIRLEFNLNTGYYNTAKNKSGDIIPIENN